jgi:cytochrome P450
MFPFPAFLWRYTPQSKSENEAIIADNRLSQQCMGMIIERKKAIAINAAPDSTYRTSLLDNLIGTKLGGENPLTDDELISNVKTFFLGGSDTYSHGTSIMVDILPMY